jgi:hypothetical protein
MVVRMGQTVNELRVSIDIDRFTISGLPEHLMI